MNQFGKTYNSFEIMRDPIFCNHPEWLIDYHKFKLSEKFMKKFKHWLDWSLLSRTQILSISFMKDMIDFLPLHIITKHQTLTSDFITWLAETQPENIDWTIISCTQKLDHDIISKYVHRLNIDSLIRYQTLSNETKIIISNYLINNIETLKIDELDHYIDLLINVL